METRNADNATAAWTAPQPPKRPFISCCRCEEERRSGGEGRWPNEVKSTSSDAAEERLDAVAAKS